MPDRDNDHSFLDVIVRAQRRGSPFGIYSVCSAHPYVLTAAMQHARQADAPLLIEATCNQVNQYGGYTGMTPADFVAYVHDLAREHDFPLEHLILGGDHLGPSVWQAEPADAAMTKARELVQAYVRAGYVKIHLDASMKLADDAATDAPDICLAAERAAVLAEAAEDAWADAPQGQAAPRYVIGTEVPPPGGIKGFESGIEVSATEHVAQTIEVTKAKFLKRGLARGWERVIAVVVQPGVEYGDAIIHEYEPEKAQELSRFIEEYHGLVYEAHSTDYQTCPALSRMVANHFAILKVGPALTFAFREAVFALEWIEREWLGRRRGVTLSGLQAALESAMLADPRYWEPYYTGDKAAQAFSRKYSLSDRCRYYWPVPSVQAALEQLLSNLRAQPLPAAPLSQYLPVQYARVRAGTLPNTPDALILDKIENILADYACACGHEARL
jgi:D-tagatose-1,6-bisphosphate aldolase subunit GatZ/KbaZ